MERGSAINGPRPASADVALAIVAATVLGVTVGVLLADAVADAVAGIAVGAGTAVVFRFVLRTIITRNDRPDDGQRCGITVRGCSL
ncbi:hypothetical protein [Rhodococcus erythropolis]|uniref:hypothetical protein n=1 Tax=Rhodococcus erythropolis TaxID=1833 RepID=UPI000413B4D5|nr:hypothetical protein [Rhodococcus erythropolis]GCB59629.1 hypothetical protein rerp_60370 [Rhodococcus erythropolis]